MTDAVMSPEQATAIDAVTKQFRAAAAPAGDVASLTLDAIWKMSDKEAIAALDKMGELYRAVPAPPANSPAAARARLQEIQSDPKYLTDYFSGNADRRREFDQIMERAYSDRTERLIAGAAIPTSDIEAGITGTETIGEINRERALGIGDDVIAQGLRTQPLATRAEYDALMQYRRDLLADHQWVSRWLGGDPLADREWRTVMKGLINGYKEAV